MTTTNLGLTKPTVGGDSDVWGGELNTDLDLIDAYLAPGQLKGTATNDSANAGSIGEYISASVASGSAVSLSTTVDANVTSISLTAGDWDVWGSVFVSLSGPNPAVVRGWISSTSATNPTSPANGAKFDGSFTTGVNNGFGGPVGMTRLSLTTTTTVYLGANCTFGSGSVGAFGFIGARRRR